jgi:hypothetical protein
VWWWDGRPPLETQIFEFFTTESLSIVRHNRFGHTNGRKIIPCQIIWDCRWRHFTYQTKSYEIGESPLQSKCLCYCAWCGLGGLQNQ